MKLQLPEVMFSIVLLVVVPASCFAGGVEPFSVEKAIQVVEKRAIGFANMSPFELQVHYRLIWLFQETGYEYQPEDAGVWEACMLDQKQNMYARLCAAYFLLDDEKGPARPFVKSQLTSNNLRYRYNAAELVRFYVGGNPKKRWGVETLVGLLADGSIDGSGVTSSPSGYYPDGDGSDIMRTPIDRICWDLGLMEEKSAVEALISILQRKPGEGEAAFALGEIGDKRAIPILLKMLVDRTDYEDHATIALGKLKCKEAVPILVSRLGHPRMTSSDFDIEEVKNILETLLAIGDSRAVDPIEKYLKGDYPEKAKAVAKRVLVQFISSDPVGALLDLLEKETDEFERSNIMGDLVKYPDSRVAAKLVEIARNSDSPFMRRQAIYRLSEINDSRSLLMLASLIDAPFPKKFKTEWGIRMISDYSVYFPQLIVRCLKERTKQDFGTNRADWEAWIRANVKP